MKKRILALSGLILALTLSASADLKIPRSVYPINQLEEAKAKAAEKSKPLVFVYTNPGST